MSVTLLHLHTQPEVPLEAEVISPTGLTTLSESGIEHLQVMHGNVKAKLGDFFKVTGKGESSIHIEGDCSNVKMIGAGMSAGKITIDGDVGMHVGMGMSGGEISSMAMPVIGLGPEMSGDELWLRVMRVIWWVAHLEANHLELKVGKFLFMVMLKMRLVIPCDVV